MLSIKSIWTESSDIPRFDGLKTDIKTNVLIIGGGMAGVLCAYQLDRAGVDYILVEGSRIGSGITKNTTAKITSQHGLIYDSLIKNAGLEKAKMYLQANELAVSKFKDLCKDIDCNFEEKNAFVYSLTNQKVIEDEVTAVHKLGVNAEFTNKLPLPFRDVNAIKFSKQAQFNPLQFIASISKNLNIYENSHVTSVDIKKGVAVCGNAKITADKIIIATHFPFINTHGSYFLKLYQHRSYVIALHNAPNIDGMYLEEKLDGLSFRNYENLLLIGGGDHRTGKTGGNFSVLRELAKNAYPNAEEKFCWATQDCMTLDNVPYIGQYARSTPNLYVATGFNKWGMTSSMVASIILKDMVMGQRNEFAQVFSPHRSMLKPQLAINGLEAVTNLLSFSKKRCPHLGCALKWNEIERTWDCPCHGSRFSKGGELIDNPATGDLNNV